MRMAASSMAAEGPKSPLGPVAGTAQSGSALERKSFIRPGAGQRWRAYCSSAWTWAPLRTSHTSSGSPWHSEHPRRTTLGREVY